MLTKHLSKSVTDFKVYKNEKTYTNYTWMSQLVPVFEVMFGVTWHSLSFNV